MVYKLYDIQYLDKIINEIEKYDRVKLVKVVTSNNGHRHKLRLGEYIIYDGDNYCEILCGKELMMPFKEAMSQRGYVYTREEKGRGR